MDHNISPGGRFPSSGRTRSLSSLSSSSSSSSCSLHAFGPATPLRIISRVPFSWEKLPGIPKNQDSKKGDHSLLLPLPPTSKPHTFESNRTKIKIKNRANVDPFFAALVECSKDDQDQDQEEASDIWSSGGSNRVSKTLSDRFSLVSLYTSCKRTCAVSESLVYLPRSTATSLKYDLIGRHSHKYKSTRF